MNNNSVSIKWEEPPAATVGVHGSIDWASIAKVLKENPGRWALVAENCAVGVQSYVKRRYGLEIKTRSAGRGYAERHGDFYARFPAGDSNE